MSRGSDLAAFSWWGPMVPSAPPWGPSSWLVLALEWWWTSGLILVVDQLSLSIHCSNMEAAASAHWWVSLALVSSCSPKVSYLSLWEALSWWQDGQALVGSGSLPPSNWSPLLCHRWSFKENKMSWLPPVLTWTYTVGVWATSLACIPDGRGPQFLLWGSGIPRAGWQVHPPHGPALGDHASDHGESTSLLPSALIQQHVQTSFEGWMGSVVPDIPLGVFIQE